MIGFHNVDSIDQFRLPDVVDVATTLCGFHWLVCLSVLGVGYFLCCIVRLRLDAKTVAARFAGFRTVARSVRVSFLHVTVSVFFRVTI